MLSFSEAGRLHQEKNTRDAGHSWPALRPTVWPEPSGGEGAQAYATGGSPSRRGDAGDDKKNDNRQPAHQTGTAGWSRSLGAKAEKGEGVKRLTELGKKSFAKLQWDVTDKQLPRRFSQTNTKKN